MKHNSEEMITMFTTKEPYLVEEKTDSNASRSRRSTCSSTDVFRNGIHILDLAVFIINHQNQANRNLTAANHACLSKHIPDEVLLLVYFLAIQMLDSATYEDNQRV